MGDERSPSAEEAYEERVECINAKGEIVKVEIPFVVRDAPDEAKALATSRTSALKVKIKNFVLDTVDVSERLGETAWKTNAVYKRDPNADVEDEDDENLTYTFDTSGGTMHMMQSLSTVCRAPDNAPNYRGAIGVDAEGNVAGVDVTKPLFNFTETHVLPATKVSQGYRVGVSQLTGSVNKDPFRGHPARSVLFLGASGTRRVKEKDSPWEITFQFSVSQNATGLNVGGLRLEKKDGWDYLWVRYGDVEDKEKKTVARVPVAAYVEKVYPDGDFSRLGIGS